MRAVPDWWIQTAWWASGIFATGAVWYFLSTREYPHAVAAGVIAVSFAGLAIVLHRKKDGVAQTAVRATAPEELAEDFIRRYTDQPGHIRFVKGLPNLRAAVYENAREGWAGSTADMSEASYDVIDFLEYAWLRLAEFYPPRHFGEMDARQYIRDFIRERFRFHWAKHEPHGPGTGGTIVGVLTGGDVIADLEAMIADTVSALFMHQDDFDLREWSEQWRGGHLRERGDMPWQNDC